MLVASLGKACLLISLVFIGTQGKHLTECEYAKLLLEHKFNHNLIPIWVCLAMRHAKFIGLGYLDTAITINAENKQRLGIFGFVEGQDCHTNKPGGSCNVKCQDLLSDNIAPSAKCALQKYNKEGFKPWFYMSLYNICSQELRSGNYWLCCD